MKKITFYFFTVLFACAFTSTAQTSKKIIDSSSNTDDIIRCHADEVNAENLKSNPNMMGSDAFEDKLKAKIQELSQQRSAEQMVVLTIPVVVHVFNNGETIGVNSNISDAQVLSQIEVLNEDFRRMLGTRGYNTNPIGADVEVQFCMAQTAPDGSPTSGINRINIGQNGLTGSGTTANEITNDLVNQVEALKPSSIWDASLYMNMWSVKFNNGGLLGYAQFPGGAANTDGVVSRHDSFGSNDAAGVTISGDFNLGRTMTHEVGHFLGLLHTFQGGCTGTGANAGDFCADTPAVASDTSNGSICNTGNDSCPSDPGLDMVENYMDYSTDACMDTFTLDQKARVQAVLATATNRASLTSSNVCNSPTTPYINFAPGSISPGQVAEGSDCNYTDYVIDLSMNIPANANATASLTNSGTATENVDFTLLNNAVTFTTGSTTPSNPITLRVFNDSSIENDETITLSINVNTTGDALAENDIYAYTIENDDNVLVDEGNAVLFSDGFETYPDFTITPVGGWTLIDNDGDSTYSSDASDFPNESYTGSFIVFNPSATTPVSNTGWDAHSGSKGYYCFNATGSVSGTPVNDDYAITPQIALNGTNSELKFWAKSLTDNYNGGERFKVEISTTNTNASSFTTISPAPYTVPPLTWTEYTYDLSSYDGQNIYIAIHVVSADEFVFLLDDVSVTADVTTLVQTEVNTTSADQINLTGVGQSYATDATTNNIMLDIDNTGGDDYGCTTVVVSRDATTAGAAAVGYNGATDATGFVTAKTFDVTATNAVTGTATVSFYFTEAELANWETMTGQDRASISAKNDATSEVQPVTITAFGSDSKLTATFTSGLTGTYYFGLSSSLSVGNFELASTISIYPNPTVSALTIKVNNSDLPTAYQVYNMLGQLITKSQINNAQDLTIDTTPFSNGMYFIKISKAGNAITLPFIKK
ncbi:T9SS-dependent choice-of-anchor J family protein [Olleya namhaensis]|uniref:T9SS-dependent choice-of-anchor J family protein n=1 Tax=Olleya namhaensis TaxID=1144750 RepID=UPI0024912294|nr:choice-of-anchor J domain-containing protein [Olleya namhaensis]